MYYCFRREILCIILFVENIVYYCFRRESSNKSFQQNEMILHLYNRTSFRSMPIEDTSRNLFISLRKPTHSFLLVFCYMFL